MAVEVFAGFAAVCATANPLIRLSAKIAMKVLLIHFLVIILSP
jgi:hypothetical protein